MQEIASIFMVCIKSAVVDNEIAVLECETSLADYRNLKAERACLENGYRSKREHWRDLQNLHDEITKVTGKYEDSGGDNPFLVCDKQNDEAALFDADLLRLRNEYLELRRNKALALEEGSRQAA
ncbi:MAG: hypothetical protein M1840_006679 [Geoglossum simile]|nr:MAG: hypothetical protein M1840_006679 [Geoglossum simile]